VKLKLTSHPDSSIENNRADQGAGDESDELLVLLRNGVPDEAHAEHAEDEHRQERQDRLAG